MPIRTTIRVEGLRQLDAALKELPKAAGKAVLRRVGIKALEPFDKAWREKAPHLTGELEESGGIGTRLTKRQARLKRKRGGKAYVEVYAGPNNPASVPQEFGTHDQKAQPFARPAWDETSTEALVIVETELGGEIDRTAQRLARRALRLAKRGGR
ncbi:HK97-gp10 family putative phage morphogenesis protein [uncultured Sphingomonas sp.]|uniref:HK97-gp10 family putative phage morphogenesis protein n=1 Tax=uncultured Sphingomonas sp. TaxID=158754 RepID=UPI0025CE1310|nr:HK97-gp10 family putative phage morphogenesis protein [uncultured Sphingomonas sp.]